ncbi:hypothetical protein NFI96_003508 [Prochilodus magdalenae]|nr:hypothetical protein NFI96_003508 [Prochilodus magdalenae]
MFRSQNQHHTDEDVRTLVGCSTSTSTSNSWDWIGHGLDEVLDVATSENWSGGPDLVEAFPGTVPRRVPCRLGLYPLLVDPYDLHVHSEGGLRRLETLYRPAKRHDCVASMRYYVVSTRCHHMCTRSYEVSTAHNVKSTRYSQRSKKNLMKNLLKNMIKNLMMNMMKNMMKNLMKSLMYLLKNMMKNLIKNLMKYLM